MDFRNERTFKVTAIVYRPNIWFYFSGTWETMFQGSFLAVPLERM